MQLSSWTRRLSRRSWIVAGLALTAAVVLAIAAIFSLREPEPVATLQTIHPGMTYEKVKDLLTQPHVAGPLAQSFGSPVKESQAVLRGEPSFAPAGPRSHEKNRFEILLGYATS